MKKKALFLLIFSFLAISCATHPKDFEKKIEAEDYIDAIFDYPWEQVYDAIIFVWKHSEDRLIADKFKYCVWDYTRVDKTMFCRTRSGWHATQYYLGIGIYFEPQGESKTRVMFVQGSFFGGVAGEARITRIVEESRFYLKNGEEAYRKYTHEESLRTKKLYRSKGWIP